jgi:hypothetical protein
MEGKIYYGQLIDESYFRIRKYEKQISGLNEFLKETKNGMEQFSGITDQRRRSIAASLNGQLLKHPMVKKLSTRLTNAIDSTYEDNILNNFQGVEEEILMAIHKLENQIEEERYHISYYERRACEAGVEEYREEEAVKGAEGISGR